MSVLPNGSSSSVPNPNGTTQSGGTGTPPETAEVQFLTMVLAGQLCGVPVLSVRDVLANQTIARIPLAPREVAGNLNLRGRIVTAIDLRQLLQLPPRQPGDKQMSIVTEQGSELYALQVDHVREVVTMKRSAMEPNPPTLPALWAEHSQGIYRVEKQLLVILDVHRLLSFELAAA
jgi:purine-binding chemotaxis protein CheW